MQTIRSNAKKLAHAALAAFERDLGAALTVAAAILVVAWGACPAMATVTLPDTGVDTEGYVTALVTAMGTVVALCVGAIFAFMAIKKGIRWVRGI